MKYLYDSLDGYFQVARNIAFENVNINDIMLMRIWAANDVVNTALAIDIVSRDEFNTSLQALIDNKVDHVDSGISKMDSLNNDVVVSAYKVQIVLKHLNDRNPKKTELKA
jgi:hypothetical protein